MRKILLLVTLVTFQISSFSQTTDVFDFAPSAVVTTNGQMAAGGATARMGNSNTLLIPGQYILIDLHSGVPVNQIKFGTYFSTDNRYIPAGYTIDYSTDGVSFTNIASETSNTNRNPSYSFVTTQARYWKLTITANQPSQTYCVITNLQVLANGAGSSTNNLFWNPSPWGSNSIGMSGGYVGIGNFDPKRALHVSGNGTNFGQWLENTGTGTSETARFSFKTASGGSDARAGVIEWYEGSTFKGDMRMLRTGGIEIRNSNDVAVFNVNNDGDIYIGNTPQKGNLWVNGNITSRKVKVTLSGWPDYVFAPYYKLPSLREVAEFIKINSHLPGIPSAKEIEANGLELGESQAALLKKIEELTLYAIQQEEQLRKQQDEISKLQLLVEELIRKK